MSTEYSRKDQIELVVKELSYQVATRLRSANCQTECVSIFVGYSKGQVDGWIYTNKVDGFVNGILSINRQKTKERIPMSSYKKYDEDFKKSLVNLYHGGKTQSYRLNYLCSNV